jgi:nucleotide-binding universal stress UspA family protein
MSTRATFLVPVDFSDCSHEVVAEAVAQATRHEAELLLLHVLEPEPGVGPDTPVRAPEGGDVTMSTLLQSQADEGMASYAPATANIPTRTLVERGPVADTIVQVATREGATGIIMGTRGRRGVARLLHGSVAEQVIRTSNVPVTALRTQYKPTCGARSCASCQSGLTAAQLQRRAELDG